MNPQYDCNRTEILKLLLTCFSEAMYLPPTGKFVMLFVIFVVLFLIAKSLITININYLSMPEICFGSKQSLDSNISIKGVSMEICIVSNAGSLALLQH